MLWVQKNGAMNIMQKNNKEKPKQFITIRTKIAAYLFNAYKTPLNRWAYKIKPLKRFCLAFPGFENPISCREFFYRTFFYIQITRVFARFLLQSRPSHGSISHPVHMRKASLKKINIFRKKWSVGKHGVELRVLRSKIKD